MAENKPISVKFEPEMLKSIDSAWPNQCPDRSTFIRKCVEEYFKKRKSLSPIPQEIYEGVAFLMQIVLHCEYSPKQGELIKEEVLRIWKLIVEHQPIEEQL